MRYLRTGNIVGFELTSRCGWYSLLGQLIEKMSTKPAEILRIPKGTLREGFDADVTVIDPEKRWHVETASFRSKGKNSPFHGWLLHGKAVMTIVSGDIKYRDL